MKTKTFRNVAFVAASISMFFLIMSFKGKEKIDQVMIYGIAYTTACKLSETYQNYRYKLVPESNYTVAMELMKKELQNQFPTATRIKVGSSKYDYGASATNMCIIRWTNTNKNCQYFVLSVHFGKTEQEALDKAISHKKEWADKDAPYNIQDQKYW